MLVVFLVSMLQIIIKNIWMNDHFWIHWHWKLNIDKLVLFKVKLQWASRIVVITVFPTISACLLVVVCKRDMHACWMALPKCLVIDCICNDRDVVVQNLFVVAYHAFFCFFPEYFEWAYSFFSNAFKISVYLSLWNIACVLRNLHGHHHFEWTAVLGI